MVNDLPRLMIRMHRLISIYADRKSSLVGYPEAVQKIYHLLKVLNSVRQYTTRLEIISIVLFKGWRAFFSFSWGYEQNNLITCDQVFLFIPPWKRKKRSIPYILALLWLFQWVIKHNSITYNVIVHNTARTARRQCYFVFNHEVMNKIFQPITDKQKWWTQKKLKYYWIKFKTL